MKIKCENESCKKDIHIDEKIICPSCKQTQKKKLMIKPLVMGAALSLFTGYGGYKISNMIHSSVRYPVKTEYSIINSCVNSDNILQYKAYLQEKRSICIKAYNKTIEQISYNEFKQNQKNFTKAFRNNIYE